MKAWTKEELAAAVATPPREGAEEVTTVFNNQQDGRVAMLPPLYSAPAAAAAFFQPPPSSITAAASIAMPVAKHVYTYRGPRGQASKPAPSLSSSSSSSSGGRAVPLHPIGSRVRVRFDDGIQYPGVVKSSNVLGDGGKYAVLYSVASDDGDALDDVVEAEMTAASEPMAMEEKTEEPAAKDAEREELVRHLLEKHAPPAAAPPPAVQAAPPPPPPPPKPVEPHGQRPPSLPEPEDLDTHPILQQWAWNSDGSLSGHVYGKSGFKEGEAMDTSKIAKDKRFTRYVVTVSGSIYRLGEPKPPRATRARA